MSKDIKIHESGDVVKDVKIINRKIYLNIGIVPCGNWIYIGILEDQLTWFKESIQPDLDCVDTVVYLDEGLYGIKQGRSKVNEFNSLSKGIQEDILNRYIDMSKAFNKAGVDTNSPLTEDIEEDTADYCGNCTYVFCKGENTTICPVCDL